MNDRQHYVFLQDGDVIQEGDEFFDILTNSWMPSIRYNSTWLQSHRERIRRPVPTAQPTDTCKWKRCDWCPNVVDNPHNESCSSVRTITDCPTCGKRIEVTE